VRVKSILLVGVLAVSLSAQAIELRPGDRVAILGNALADRFQHSGWLEAMLHAAHPQHELVVRTLAVAGDEITTWHRSQGFGTRDEWLRRVEADVVLAFYGFNESFAGDAGLSAFRAALGTWIDDLRGQRFSDRGAPRLLLFTPIANERHLDPAIPDPAANNVRLRRYAAAMREVATAKRVPCIDLLAPSERLFAAARARGASLTVNGLHLTDDGDRLLADAIADALLGDRAPAARTFTKDLHHSVLAKNRAWHDRYRTIDGFNVYGGRSYEKYAPKDHTGTIGEPILNRTVMQREMAMRDVQTKNADRRVWAAARGEEAIPADDPLPDPIPVATNHPGDRPDLSWSYPSGEEVIDELDVAPGCRVSLFADERMFPALVNPVQMMFDARGRLWVAVWPHYPERTPTSTSGDALLVLEDTNGDGRADRCTTFLDDLNAPTGFTFHRDGVLVMQAPNLWFVRDVDGDGVADERTIVVMGIDSADSHHTTNAMGLDPACNTTFSDGYFHRTQIETHDGPLRHADGCLWRYEPRSGRVELHAAYELVNAHGKVWDAWGNDLVTNATGNHTFFGPAISGRLDHGKHPGMKEFWARPSRPCPGTGMVSSAHFPADWQGDFLNLNVIGLLAITRVDVLRDGSGLRGETVEHVVSADPKKLPSFRPICITNGLDGALWFADWAQVIIGHLQHHLRDPNRDHAHGRIYRITHDGRPLATPPRIAGEPIEVLVALLKDPIQDTRTLAKLELGQNAPADVLPHVRAFAASLGDDAGDAHHLLEALWTCQSLDLVERPLLDRLLRSPEPRARAAATKVLVDWRRQVPDAIDLLLRLAEDADSRVRLHAVRGASFFGGDDTPRAAGIVFAALRHETDYYLDYVVTESLRQLRTQTSDVLLPKDDATLALYAQRLPDHDLLRAPDRTPILHERLDRRGIAPATRRDALDRLATQTGMPIGDLVAASLHRIDARKDGAAEDLARLVLPLDTAALLPGRSTFLVLSGTAENAAVRRAAHALSAAVDGDGSRLFASTDDWKQRRELLQALSLVPAPALRATFAAAIERTLADATAPTEARAAALAALPLVPTDEPERTFAVLAKALADGEARPTTARALLQLPRITWQTAAADAAAQSVLSWAEKVPAKERTSEDFLDVVRCADQLASALPAERQLALRTALRALAVPTFVLHTVREQMRYDQDRLVVEAGKPFEIVLVNDDFMAHNLLVTAPGTKPALAAAARTMSPSELDDQGRAYLPKLPGMLAATGLVESGHRQKLQVQALTEGEYPFFCSVPGHDLLMAGTIVATKDVAAWLRANPTPALDDH
jgi:azurin/lysophospholipase L1-like esterase